MCRLKSAIILKDRVFIPDYDSHSDMLEELGIDDIRENAERLFVRAELTPKHGDVFSPVDEWSFAVDQDLLPDWFVFNYDRQRMIDAVKLWAKDRIHVKVDGIVIDTGINHYIKDCKDVTIRGNTTIESIYGNTTIKHISENATVGCICDDATVEHIRGNTTVEHISGNTTVNCIRGNATINCICGNATINCICGNATAIGYQYGWKNKDRVELLDNATFKDVESKTIYQAGDWKFKRVDSHIKEDT